ncbi:hypothetical protein HZC35_03570 [Candidatus Saganbacteria bacterium]|nr:hypothetical protein [Candidatus Saganbacteria bacterium]
MRREPNLLSGGYFNPAQLLTVWSALYTNRYLTPVGSTGALLVTDPSTSESEMTHRTSEGLGYGMLISSLLASTQDQDLAKLQEQFDGMLIAVREAMRLGEGLPAWSLDIRNGEIVLNDAHPDWGPQNSATDAELDIWFALKLALDLVAQGKWQSNPQYQEIKDKIKELIKDRAVTDLGNDQLVLDPSEDWGSRSGQVHLNPSYLRIAYFKMMAEESTGEERTFFEELARDSLTVLNNIYDRYGDIPDWVEVRGGDLRVSDSETPGHLTEPRFDSLRWPIGVAMSAILFNDQEAREFCRKVLEKAGTDSSIIWQTSGTDQADNAMAYLVALGSGEERLIEAYSAKVKGYFNSNSFGEAERYFNNSLPLIALLLAEYMRRQPPAVVQPVPTPAPLMDPALAASMRESAMHPTVGTVHTGRPMVGGQAVSQSSDVGEELTAKLEAIVQPLISSSSELQAGQVIRVKVNVHFQRDESGEWVSGQVTFPDVVTGEESRRPIDRSVLDSIQAAVNAANISLAPISDQDKQDLYKLSGLANLTSDYQQTGVIINFDFPILADN